MDIMVDPTRAIEISRPRSRPSGTAMFVNWQRIAEALRESGCIRSDEAPIVFVVEDDGMTVFLEYVKPGESR